MEDGEARDHMAERVFGLSHSLGLDSDAVKTQLRKVCSHLVCQRILSSSDDENTSGSDSARFGSCGDSVRRLVYGWCPSICYKKQRIETKNTKNSEMRDEILL